MVSDSGASAVRRQRRISIQEGPSGGVGTKHFADVGGERRVLVRDLGQVEAADLFAPSEQHLEGEAHALPMRWIGFRHERFDQIWMEPSWR